MPASFGSAKSGRLRGRDHPRLTANGLRLAVIRRDGQHLRGDGDRFAPALPFGRVVEPRDRFGEPRVPVFHFRAVAIQTRARRRQLRRDASKLRDRANELSAIREFLRLKPALRRAFELLQVRVAHAAVAALGDLVEGVDGATGFEHRADLHERHSRQRLPQFRDRLIAGVERFRGNEIAPRGVGVVLVECLAGARDVCLHDFARHLVRAAVPLREERFEDPVRLVGASGVHRLLSLTQHQPTATRA